MNPKKIFDKILALIFILLILIAIFFEGYEGDNKFVRETYCKINKPKFNISHDKKIAYCYGEYWNIYCTKIYPEHCPKTDYYNIDEK